MTHMGIDCRWFSGLQWQLIPRSEMETRIPKASGLYSPRNTARPLRWAADFPWRRRLWREVKLKKKKKKRKRERQRKTETEKSEKREKERHSSIKKEKERPLVPLMLIKSREICLVETFSTDLPHGLEHWIPADVSCPWNRPYWRITACSFSLIE
jgi:hypothetical protein